MSVVATNWAWGQLLPPAPKLVLMSLADNADEEGYCWPRVKNVAKRCNVSERTVQRTLRTFEGLGLLKVTRRFRPESGRQTSNGYQLSLRVYPDKLSPSPSSWHPDHVEDVTDGASTRCQGGDVSAMAPLEPPQQPSSSPPPQPGNEDGGLVLPESLDPLLSIAMKDLLAPCGRLLGQAIADEVEGMVAKGRLRSCPLALAKSLRERAAAGTFSPHLGLEVAAKRTAAQKRSLEEKRRELLKAIRLAEENDPERKRRSDAARAKAVKELKKRGL